MQKLELHKATAMSVVALNLALYSAPITDLHVLLILTVFCGLALGVVSYLAQSEWHHDTKRSAFTKALIITLATILPRFFMLSYSA